MLELIFYLGLCDSKTVSKTLKTAIKLMGEKSSERRELSISKYGSRYDCVTTILYIKPLLSIDIDEL